MSTVLFTWNPLKWQWNGFETAIVEVNAFGSYREPWSCANRNFIRKGDRAFLVRLGSQPRGLVGSGVVVSEVYESHHWNKEKPTSAKQHYVDIEFDVLSNLPVLTPDELIRNGLNDQTWLPQSSGIRILEPVAQALEKLWAAALGVLSIESGNTTTTYLEGQRRIRAAVAIERNPAARQQCLEHHGYACIVCGFHFEKVYGAVGRGFIHVHHKNPLGLTTSEHPVDPANDLIPVCPNCHAMLHSRRVPLTVDELKFAIVHRWKTQSL